MIPLDARRVRLTVGFTAVLLLLLAGAPVPSALAACPEEGPPGATSDPPRAPQVAPPQPDLDWPIVSQVTSVTTDPVSGRLMTSTVTVRENPLPRPHRPDVATGTAASDPAPFPIGPQLALAACSFQT